MFSSREILLLHLNSQVINRGLTEKKSRHILPSIVITEKTRIYFSRFDIYSLSCELNHYKRVVLLERKRHATRRVASTCSIILMGITPSCHGGTPSCPDWARGYLSCPGQGVHPRIGTGVPSSGTEGTPGKRPKTSHWGTPYKRHVTSGSRSIMGWRWVTPRKDKGPVEVLWDGDGVPLWTDTQL